jgi:hypothetical protein
MSYKSSKFGVESLDISGGMENVRSITANNSDSMMSYESSKLGVKSLDISGGMEKEASFTGNISGSMMSSEPNKVGERPIPITKMKRNVFEDRIILNLVHKKHEETLVEYDDCHSKKESSKKCCVFKIFSKCLGK